MENYQKNEQFGKGVISISYFCQPENDKKSRLVLKELECQDMTNAQKALDELKIFHSLDHRYISKLKDSFIRWDKKTSTAYVCYVMDYYKKGNLASFANILRSNRTVFPFNTVLKWIGNLVEAVHFIHQNQLVHRNLKSGSLYLHSINSEKDAFNSDLVVGDYGVPTIMKDARVKTRILQGAFDYAAPELIDAQPFDYKTDIWTIGTTLLDICTTSLYDSKTFHLHLLNIRHDQELLQKILNDIYQVYESKSLVNLLRKILNVQNEKRPSIKALIQEYFVQECLELIDSPLVIDFKEPILNQTTKHGKGSNQLESLLNSLNQKFNDETRVELYTEQIAQLIHSLEADKIKLDDRDNILAKLLQKYSHSPIIMLNTLDIVDGTLKLIVTQKRFEQRRQNEKEANRHDSQLVYDSLTNTKLVQKFFYVFLKYNTIKEIQLSAVKVIIQLANFENASDELASYDVVKYLLDTLKNFDSESLLNGLILKAIWCLCVNDKIMGTLWDKCCLAHVRNTIVKHQTDAFCVEMACNVVVAMCMNERLISKEEINVDSTSAILLGLQHHLDSTNVVKSACLAFCSLIALFEESAFRFLYLPAGGPNGADLEGFELLRRAYYNHKDDSQTVEHICQVYKELTTYDEMVVEMKSIKLNENLLDEIEKRYRDNREINQLCCIVSAKIEDKIKQDLLSAATNA